jgi:hypothetical protein
VAARADNEMGGETRICNSWFKRTWREGMAKRASSINNNDNNKEGLAQQHDNTSTLKSNIEKHDKYTTSTIPLVSPTTNPIQQNTIVITMDYTAISDTAATGNYVTTNWPVINWQPGVNVIHGLTTALLQLTTELPAIGARIASIHPDVKPGSLIPIKHSFLLTNKCEVSCCTKSFLVEQ